MIGRIIGAYAGDKIARQTNGIGGATGAVLGVVAAAALRRMSLPAILAVGVGGYVVKKLVERQEANKAQPQIILSETSEPETRSTATAA